MGGPLSLLLLLILSTRAAPVEDFERGRRWLTGGPIQVSQETGPGGSRALHLVAGREGAVAFPQGMLAADWSQVGALSLRVHRDARPSDPPTVVELRLPTRSGGRFWRKIELTHQGAAELVLPLAWFRWGGRGRVPRWTDVDGLALYFRSPGAVWVDDLALVPGDPLPGVDDVLGLGVLDAPRSLEGRSGLIVTDAPDLDLEVLDAHLARVRDQVLADLPFLAPLCGPPMLVVTQTRAGQHALVHAITGAAAATDVDRVPAGFTLLGIATSSWEAELGSLRPVYAHEYVHSLLHRSCALLDGDNDWVQEGLATRYQLRAHPEAAPPADQTAWMEVGGLQIILDGGSVENRNGGYMRAWSVVGLLLEHPRYAPHRQALLRAFAESGSNALEPQLGPVLGVDRETFLADWQAWTQSQAAPTSGAAD